MSQLSHLLLIVKIWSSTGPRMPPVEPTIVTTPAVCRDRDELERSRRQEYDDGIRVRECMMTDMGTFRIDIEIENPGAAGTRRELRNVLVDTGAELSWVPAESLEALGIKRRKQVRFRQADGSILERWVGSTLIYAAGTSATDDVVFGEPTDMVLLGARSLEGLNLRIDPVRKVLIDAGPVPAAYAA